MRSVEAKGTLKTKLAGAVADALVPADSAKAVEMIVDYQLPNKRDALFSHYTNKNRFQRAFTALARSNPALAAGQALRLNDSWQRAKALAPALEVWGETDPMAALAFLKRKGAFQQNDDQGPAWAAFSKGIAKRSPEDAVTMILENAPTGEQSRALKTAIEVWAEVDSEAAYTYVGSEILEGDVNAYVGIIARAWAEQDASAALEWAKLLTDETRVQALSKVSSTLATTNPIMAFEAYAESGNPDVGRRLIRQSASRDWLATIDTLEQWEDIELRGHAAANLLGYAYEASRPLGEQFGTLVGWIAEASGNLKDHQITVFFNHLNDDQLIYLKESHPGLYQRLLPSIVDSYVRYDLALGASMVPKLGDPKAKTKPCRMSCTSGQATHRKRPLIGWRGNR